MCAVKYACVIAGVSTLWHGDRVVNAIKGIRKLQAGQLAGKLVEKFLMSEVLLERMVMLADAMDEEAVAVLLLAWAFLSRAQSEAFPLECGTAEELRQLPKGRRSAVVCDLVQSPPTVQISWARRKHRPRGSLLMRKCECAARKSFNLCVVCRTANWMQQTQLAPGQRLFPTLGSLKNLATVRRILKHLREPAWQAFTWKCLRASKATSLAGQGMPLQTVLAMGE